MAIGKLLENKKAKTIGVGLLPPALIFIAGVFDRIPDNHRLAAIIVAMAWLFLSQFVDEIEAIIRKKFGI